MTAPKTALADPTKLPNFLAWLEALRSGEFAQAKSVLRRHLGEFAVGPSTRYCCLGVATELACRAGVRPVIRECDKVICRDVNPEHVHDLWCIERPFENLAPEVTQWLGFGPDQQDPVIGRRDLGDGAVGASTLNDGGTDFHEIAARLEAVYVNGEKPATCQTLLPF